MNMFRAFMELDKLQESFEDRQEIIKKFKERGINYHFEKYSDKQLYRMWEKELKKNTNKNSIKNNFEFEASPEHDYSYCTFCGKRLTEGGYCPVCDDGAEDLTEAIDSALTDFIKIIGKHGGVVKIKSTDNSTRFLVVSDLSMHEHREIDVQIAKDLISTLDLVYDDTRSNELFSFFTFQKNIVENLAKLLHENWADDALADLKSKPRNLWTEEDWETYNYCLNANAERDYYDSLED